jgi:putative endopeptidase
MHMPQIILYAAVLLVVSLSNAQQTRPPAKPQPVLDLSSMDQTIDPCTDFYTYSCGGWMKKNPIPPDQSSWSAYGKLQDENTAQLRSILEAAAVPDRKRNAANQKIGDYYAACMDEKGVETTGIKPLRHYLAEIDKLTSKSELAQVVAERAYWLPYRHSTMFRFGANQDAKDSTQMIAETDQGGLGMPDRDYYFKDDAKSQELRKAYLAHVQKMLELLGDKPETAAAEAQTVMRIETALAQGSMTRVERRDPQKLYHKMSVQEFEALTPSFQWNTYFVKVGLSSLASLNVAAPDFFKTLNAEIDREELASWKSYLRWHLVEANARYLPAAFVNADFDFHGKILSGAEQIEPRWKRCTEDVDGDLGEALGQAYVEKYFSAEAKQKVVVMVKEIESAMQQDVNALPWMSAGTKPKAIEKLHAVANKIGYPDKWRDYSKLEVTRADEMGNALRARQFEFNRQLAKIGKPVDHGEWDMTPPTVNAYYNPQMNDINFPAGVLQPPLFDPKSDAAPNYGNTGGTIGHELTHGFDDEGRQFDAQGNLRDWWTPEDEKEFVERASCISDQYSTYTIIDDIKINGKLTLGEDVADVGGLILAYMAWKEHTKGQTLQPIDGLTPDQRFFVGYGQSWCSNERDENKRLRATVDPHSPEKYRTNGVVSNMPEFPEAFHCKDGSAMVNQNRCRVW